MPDRKYPIYTRCKSCGRAILMIPTIRGVTRAVDATPRRFVPDLNSLVVYITPDGMELRGALPRPEDSDVHVGYSCHSDTCPKADLYRKSRRKEFQ